MVELKDLIKVGIHFGHKTSRWCPQMAPFIWGEKNKIHLIDISKTAILLERAANFLRESTQNGRQILWIGTKKAAQPIIKKVSDELKMPYVINRWVGGTLSNFDQIKKAITHLLHLQDAIKKMDSYHTKKELSALNKEIYRLERNVGGIINLNYPPAVIVVVDAKKERAAVKEALSHGIPVIAMVDTNTDPTGINFVIPSNDDSSRSVAFILNYLETYAKKGQDIYRQKQAEKEAEKIEKKREKLKAKTKPLETKKVKEDLEKPKPTSKKEEKQVSKTEDIKTISKKITKEKPATVKKEIKEEKKSKEKTKNEGVTKKAASKAEVTTKKKVIKKKETTKKE